jgi:hypothetical protein
MARARSGGGSAAFAWALVVVGTGFFIFLILFIVTYTQNEKYKQTADEAVAELDDYANRGQRNSQEVQQIVSNLTGGQTVVERLLEQRSQLKSMITPDANLAVEAIQAAKVDQREIPGPLFAHVESLEQTINAREQELESARAAQAAAQQRANEAIEQRDQLAAKFQDDLDQAAATYNATEAKFTEATAGYDQMVADLRAEMERIRQEMQTQIDNKDAQIEELRAENAVLTQRIAQLEAEKTEELGPPDVVPADGQIVSLVTDQEKVYINRGSEDYLQLGMTFEVFEEDQLIKLNNYDELRGKATIEVLSLDDTTAVARIVRRQRGSTLTPGDQIANLIYDPNATYKFYVYGDFDIDNSGRATTRDRDRIQSMIARWGGQISDELNWDVDFLVLGKEPPLPEPLDPDEIDPTVIRAHAEMTKNYETYNRPAGTARDLSVPVLNQNRFLALVGYYRR